MRSVPISQAELERLVAGAAALEQDERGIKVFALENGDILKIFRVRHRLSVAWVYSYARRFCRNAERLRRRNIPTVRVKQLLQLETPAETAVLYAPLVGTTLRDLLRSRALTTEEARTLGRFIAQLHRRGIHFRSLHLGNIVLTRDGTLGLIDIADMHVYPWRLLCNTRARNFRHLHRYPEQIRQLGPELWHVVKTAYFDAARLNAACEVSLRLQLEKISVFATD